MFCVLKPAHTPGCATVALPSIPGCARLHPMPLLQGSRRPQDVAESGRTAKKPVETWVNQRTYNILSNESTRSGATTPRQMAGDGQVRITTCFCFVFYFVFSFWFLVFFFSCVLGVGGVRLPSPFSTLFVCCCFSYFLKRCPLLCFVNSSKSYSDAIIVAVHVDL